jgi:hypothetical protein
VDISQNVSEVVKYRGAVTSARELYVLPHTLLDFGCWTLDFIWTVRRRTVLQRVHYRADVLAVAEYRIVVSGVARGGGVVWPLRAAESKGRQNRYFK